MATEKGKAHGISIWLSASRDHALRKSSSKVIHATTGPNFEPHITVCALPKANTDSNLDEIIAKLKPIVQQLQPNFSVNLKKVLTGKTYFQSVFVEVEKTTILNDLYNSIYKAFSQYTETQEFNPHLSLFYGDHNETIANSIKTLASEEKLENTVMPIFSVDLYQTEGAVEDWVHLGSIRIGDDLFFHSALFINNQWVSPIKKQFAPVVNPAARETFHFFPCGTSEDIDKAVSSANTAFASWSQTDGKSRAQYLRAIASKIREKKQDMARIETLDNGKPITESSMDMDDSASCFDYYANQAEELDKKQEQSVKLSDEKFSCKLRYEPVGVAGLIVPWNYPLLMASWKVAPCLAAGCTGILKPSELTPMTALELASICKEVKLPPGVLNVVTGFGPDAGQPLSNHADVEKIAFTGSVATGSRVMGNASTSLKKVTLELGGKSPLIIFDDTDVKQAVEWIMFGIFFNQGQVCSATSRVLIQEAIYDKVLQKLREEIQKIKIGPGLDKSTKLGPIVSEGQYNRVLSFIKKGQEEGAKIITGGIPQKEELLKGFFVEPTVFADVPENASIWRDEIFGPVLCVKPFKTEESAIDIANKTHYGLAGAVMSKDKARCSRVAKSLRAGIIWVNCSQPTFIEAPWGGMKKSGCGRELGPWGLENYLEIKQITSYEEEGGLGYAWYITG